MEAEYIIVQAGGLGTRLGKLTKNRPKSIVPVNNLPIIFHLFRKYPKKKYIIIGDYKFDILRGYLQTFANVDYLLIKAKGKGNGAGIQKALKYIPINEPFMLIWSDLILSEQYIMPDIKDICYVGLSKIFTCSWKMCNGLLEKESSIENGVAGCFLLKDKSYLESLPEECSFTKWLQSNNIPLTEMDMMGSKEVGTAEAIYAIDPGENRCRPYNNIEFIENKVIKTGLTSEGKNLIDRESRWYRKVSAYGFQGIPQIYNYNPLTMERINGDNIFKANLDDYKKKQTINRLVDSLNTLHGYEMVAADCFGLKEDYYFKTIKRIQGIRDAIPFTNKEYIILNGKICRNIFYYSNDLEKQVCMYLFDAEFGPIHGDCTLTNTMINRDGTIYFIDARGYFGKREVIGDIYYDWAKLYYSISGCFDQFNIKNFDLEIGDTEVRYAIASSGWEHLTEYFLSKIPNCNIKKIKLIHAIVWISLASHCWEDYDSMCLAFYNGVYLWNEWMEDYAL